MTSNEKIKRVEYRKDLWARGEWDDEPDRMDFIHAGYSCFILRNQLGNLCGYVGIPQEHPSYGADPSNVDVDVHGGLTYAGKCNGHICHVPEPGMPDDVWWFGFDCGHYEDLCPFTAEAVHAIGFGAGVNRAIDVTYKNMAYVMQEVKSLAEQLREKHGD
jgi:hypothetical protein